MQILASALPGFRELRAPVVAGYLWLIVVWVVVNPDLASPPDDPLGASLYELGTVVGKAGILVSASIAAYLIGSASHALGTISGLTWNLFVRRNRRDLVPDRGRIEDLFEAGRWAVKITVRDTKLLEDRYRQAKAEASAELNLPATLLVGKEPELFAEVDRLRGEGEFRQTIFPPLVAMILFAGLTDSAYWFAGLGVALVLLHQGTNRLASSRRLVAQAISRNLAPSTAADSFEAWIKSTTEARAERP